MKRFAFWSIFFLTSLIVRTAFCSSIYHPTLEKSSFCPDNNKPFAVIKGLEREYYYPELERLNILSTLHNLTKEEIPDFIFEDVCQTTPESGCEMLSEIKKHQNDILRWNQSNIVQQTIKENESIRKKNEVIELKNKAIDKQKSYLKQYTDILQILGFNTWSHTSFVVDDDFRADTTYTLPKGEITPLREALRHYFISVNYILNQNARKENNINANNYIRDKNRFKEQENQKIEKLNAKTLSEARKYWTTEKKLELLSDYGEFIKNNCVGCDYKGSIPTDSKDACLNSCPNRAWKDGKCILKEKTF